MKIAVVAAAALLLAAVVPGAQATSTKTPVDPICPLRINVTTQNQFIQDQGGYIILTVDNPSKATVSGVTISYNLAGTTTNSTNFPDGGLIALQPGSSKAGVRKRGKSSLGAPLPTISPNGRVVTYSNFAVSGGEKMKLGVPLDINCGVRRAANVNPTYSYIGTDGTTTCDQNRNPTRTLANIIRITPCGNPVTANGAKGQVTFVRYAAAYRNCQDPLTAITTGVNPQACADACAANHECRSFVINPAGDTCKLYKGNPGDGNSRSFLAYTDTNAQGFQIFMAVSKGSRGLALTAANPCTKPF